MMSTDWLGCAGVQLRSGPCALVEIRLRARTYQHGQKACRFFVASANATDAMKDKLKKCNAQEKYEISRVYIKPLKLFIAQVWDICLRAHLISADEQGFTSFRAFYCSSSFAIQKCVILMQSPHAKALPYKVPWDCQYLNCRCSLLRQRKHNWWPAGSSNTSQPSTFRNGFCDNFSRLSTGYTALPKLLSSCLFRLTLPLLPHPEQLILSYTRGQPCGNHNSISLRYTVSTRISSLWRSSLLALTQQSTDAWIIFCGLLGLVILTPERNVPTIDAYFFGASASTESGLNT